MGKFHAIIGFCIVAALFVGLTLFMSQPLETVTADQAEALGDRQVMFNGQVMNFSTVARQFTLKLTGDATFDGMSAEEFLADIMLNPQEWSARPILLVKDKRLRSALRIDHRLVAPLRLFNGDNYIPDSLYQGGDGPLDKSILMLDEKMSLFARASEGTLFTFLPGGEPGKRSPMIVKAETLYNHIDPLKWFCIICFAASAIVFAASFSGRRRSPQRFLLTATFIIGAAIYAWSWAINEQIPLAGSGPIMQFMAVAIIAACIIFIRNNSTACGIGLLMSGFASLTAMLAFNDPPMTPLMPALSSIWLPIHVSLVMIAYSLLSLTMPLSVIGLAHPGDNQWGSLCLKLLRPGLVILGLGIVTGSLWAKESWGSYWSWDPKETWALVTFLLYALPLVDSLKAKRAGRRFFILSLIAFASMLITYIAPNYLHSLHAYQ